MKILLIVSLFPPVRHIGAWRWGRLCRHLAAAGCQIQVITTTQGFWSSSHEDSEPVPCVKIDRVDFPSNFVMAYLEFVQNGASKFGKKNQATASGKSPNQLFFSIKRFIGMMLRYLSEVPKPIIEWITYPHYSKYWSKQVIAHCSEKFNASDFDTIIASHPYAGTLLAAKDLSSRWGVPWIADFRDPWTHDHQGPFWNDPKKVRRMWEFEGRTLESASAVVVMNEQTLKYFNALEEKKHVLTNSFDPREYEVKWGLSESTDKTLNLCYAGSLGEGYEYRLFLDGLKMFQDHGVGKVIFHYYGNDYSRLEAYAGEIDLNVDCLNNHGVVSHQVANQALANADCGIVFGWRGSMAKIVATGKVFDSLGVGVPILGICSVSGSAMQDIIEQSASGTVLHSVTEIADFLNSAVEAKKENQLIEFIAPNYSDGKKEIYTTQSVAKEYEALLTVVAKG